MKKMIIALVGGLVFTIIYELFFGDFHSRMFEPEDLVLPSAISAALLYAYRAQVVSFLKLNIDAADEDDDENAQATGKVLFILSSIFLGMMSSGLYNAFTYGYFFTDLIRVVLTVVVVFGVYTLLQRSNTDSDSDF